MVINQAIKEDKKKLTLSSQYLQTKHVGNTTSIASGLDMLKKNFFHGSTCKVDKRGTFGAQNTSLPLKIRKKGFSRLHRAHFFYKEKSSKYKGKLASGSSWLSFLT